jgi:long-chain fatty acid transport protein
MRSRSIVSLIAALALVAGRASPALATDGHFLHGVGAINSAMGGVGVAAPGSLLGAFYVNPAGLVGFHGTAFELGFEMFKAERTLRSTAGPMSGATESGSDFTPIPAFGWSREVVERRLVVGVAGLGIGGFGVDYHVDITNPITSPRPFGFGQIYSNFSLMKIIPAAALRVNDDLRIGAAINLDWASLAVDPMPIAAPAVDPGEDGTPGTMDDRAYYSRATDADGAFGIGAQVGLQYMIWPTVAVGLAYTSPQVFQKFEYGAVYENPNLASYNTPRTIRFAMDVPPVYAAGVAWSPGEALMIGLDGKYIDYASTRGFEESGFAPDGAVRGFGWESIWTFGTGLEFRPVPRAAIRLGYNYSDNPIPSAMSMFNTPAPAVVQHHATVGAGWKFRNGFGVDVAYYRAFENSVSGPFQTMAGAAPGTAVSSTMSENSFLVGFTFNPVHENR